MDSVTSPFGIGCGLFAGRLVRDRFNVLNKYSKINWVDSVDKVPEPVTVPLADLMDRRAQELIAEGSISSQWSGGVDSTALLLALIRNGIKKQDLLIYCDENSVREYPKLYEWLVEEGYSIKKPNRWRKGLSKAPTDLITNGWCADQLFGSIFFHNAPKMYYLPIAEFLKKISILDTPISEDQANQATEVFQKYAKDTFDLDLSIAAQLGWFINFTMKWTWVSTFNELFLAGLSNSHKTKVFYDTPYFQGWSLANYTSICKRNIYGKDALYYKRELKEYCNSVFPDNDFLTKKSKNPSWNAARTNAKPERGRITVKTEKGMEILNLPSNSPINLEEIYKGPFFTRYFK